MRLLLSFLVALRCVPAQTLVIRNAADQRVTGIAAPGSLVVPANVVLDIPDPGQLSATVQAEGRQPEPAPIVRTPFHFVGIFSGLAVQLPPDIPLGPAELSLSANGQPLGSGKFTVVESSFRLFTIRGGTGPAVVEDHNLANPALAGQTAAVLGTGLGNSAPDQVRVLLGGHAVPVVSLARSPDVPGVDRITFAIPTDPAIPDNCFAAIEVRVRGEFGNVSTIPKASQPGVCSSGANLNATETSILASGSTIPFLPFSMNSEVAQGTPYFASDGFLRNESFLASITFADAGLLAAVFGPAYAEDSFDECRLDVTGGFGFVIGFGPDFGQQLTITGPNANLSVLPAAGVYSLSAPTGPPVESPDRLPPPLFVPGSWTVANSTRGPAIDPFQTSITLPPVMDLQNYAELRSIDRSKDLRIKWDGTGYSADDSVNVMLNDGSGNSATCRAHATNGRIVVPSALLQKLVPAAPFLQVLAQRRPDRLAAQRLTSRDIFVNGLGSVMRYFFSESFPVALR